MYIIQCIKYTRMFIFYISCCFVSRVYKGMVIAITTLPAVKTAVKWMFERIS